MRCISPLNATYDLKGNLTLNRNTPSSPGLIGMQLPCRKCLACRLNSAREKAVRAVHEAQTSFHDSIFVTLTYSPENLTSPFLDYTHFQNFMKNLRDKRHGSKPLKLDKIKMMVTGEYGEKDKRPHWHALLFNYWPNDAELWRTSETGHKIYRSTQIESCWKYGYSEFGTITIDSAGYVARYASKKLVHGKDQEHNFHPVHKTSNGLGLEWIKQNWKRTFENGNVILPNGQPIKIPRYYVDWFRENHPNEYNKYVTEVRTQIIDAVERKERKEELDYLSALLDHSDREFNTKTHLSTVPIQRKYIKHNILKRKFKKLQENLKL